MAKLYNQTDLFIPMGCEFGYENANNNFGYMDDQIKHIQDHFKKANLNIFYSTPSAYYKAIKKYNTYGTHEDKDLVTYNDGSSNE